MATPSLPPSLPRHELCKPSYLSTSTLLHNTPATEEVKQRTTGHEALIVDEKKWVETTLLTATWRRSRERKGDVVP